MVTTPNLSTAAWRKSSYSNNDGGMCVEVADNLPGIVPVRDSKNPDRPVLIFPNGSWSAFITSLKNQRSSN
ncbi:MULTISPECIES: DUF397 domain-containing protein [Streptomyces]|uniref:DUF397 domain-containing protein n=1 Tax=Streptomyces TaxID=1883 RepID=UPI000F7974A1|nr:MULTISPECIES: DUF397 domain-containing protein [unclassified Streptomyces]AJZ85053.1 DUF397 domain-containing protein [Streptomyces sp. AgN23]RSS45892.1 DUF397 domain-containing protein [Streptomyces sp. WAC05858]WTA80773.1 DUF397 domain-containing protein [Streptomyces antimycoticus]WTB08786.1 DUF397 domain-containing protein [Streptomyces antimycoticus]